MKKNLISKITTLLMALILMSNQILPVMAEETTEEVVIADYDGEDTEEVIVMDDETSKDIIITDDVVTEDVAEATETTVSEDAIIPEDETEASDDTTDNNRNALGGLTLKTDFEANAVDESITYEQIQASMNGNNGNKGYNALGTKPAYVPIERAFPASYAEPETICNYFDEKYPICRDQNPYGTCWAFAATTSAEFYLINHGYADKSIDTSELALAYWTYYNGTVGPAGDNYNRVNRKYKKSDYSNFLQSGGHALLAAQTLFQMRGLTNECNAPYDTAKKVLKDEKLDSSTERSNDFCLTNVVSYDRFNNANLMKHAIKENGAVTAAIYWSYDYYDEKNNTYYCNEELDTNHFVTVVGWDDDFPVDKFTAKEGVVPGCRGAWLIRNSWNSDNSGAEMKDSDYFWIAYDDYAMNDVSGFQAIPASDCTYDNAYYYDTQIHNSKQLKSKLAYVSSGNVYKANAGAYGEILNAVTVEMFKIDSDGTNYTIEVYKNVKEGEDPTSGEKVAEATTEGILYLSGTYTINLNSEVYLEPDENFGIVITRDDARTVSYATSFDQPGWNLYSSCNAYEGQSWYKTYSSEYATEWTDNEQNGNFIIHALTKDAPQDYEVTTNARVRLNPDYIDVNAKIYALTAMVEYNDIVGYTGKKIKVGKDMECEILSSSLYDIVKDLSWNKEASREVITWKFVAKKNKKMGSNAYFVLKASVNTQVAKANGINGRHLKLLKKAVKAFNKNAAKQTNRLYFQIV